MEQQRYVGDILLRHGALDAERLEELLEAAAEKDADLLELLFRDRETDEAPIVKALADEVGIGFREEVKSDEVSAELLELVPIAFARTHRVLPLQDDGVRSPNRWLQYLVQAVIERLLRDHARPGQVQALPIDLADLEQRVQAVLEPLGRG